MKQSKYYSVKLKKIVVQSVAAGLISEEKACLKYQLSPTLLHQWQRWHQHYFIDPLLNPTPMVKKNAALADKDKIKDLEKQLKLLKKEKELSDLQAAAYKTMIEVAEKEFNISIEKKRGAK